MTIVVTGGGSGGHITPILAVANELKKLQPAVKIVYIGQRGESLLDIPTNDPNIDAVFTVRAGKFRRYSGEGWKQFLAVPTQAKNIRDVFRVLIGIWQSFWLLRKLKPSIILTRGGFVSVPVALGGVLNHIPYITHDSDSIPSLANRIIARWAILHAVALPEKLYPYPQAKTTMVGIPLSAGTQPVTPQLEEQYRDELGLSAYKKVVLVTGGGNGAQQLNMAFIKNAAALLNSYPALAIIHIAGRPLEAEVNAAYDEMIPAPGRARVQVFGFVDNFYRYSGAADVIVARAGATNLAAFALQAKPCVIVPAAQLVGGHQVKNAQALADAQAIIMLNESQSEQAGRLSSVISQVLDDKSARHTLSSNLAKFARPDAAKELAMLLLEKAKPKHKEQ